MIGNIIMLVIGLAIGAVGVWIVFNTILKSVRKAAGEQIKLLSDARVSLTDAFKALSSDALNNNNQSFLALAETKLGIFKEGAKGDLEKREQAIDNLVKPLNESLDKLNRKIAQIETDRTSAYSALTQQVGSMVTTQTRLQTETANLVNALRAPQVRGRWGEIQLRHVVELAGMLDH